MANVLFTLSTKQNAGKSELLVRFYASRAVDLRAHTRLYVPYSLWNDKMQRLVIPRRFVTEDTISATECQSRVDELRTLILNRYMETNESDLNKDWLQSVIAEFNHDEQTDHILIADMVEQYANAKNLFDSTKKQYDVIGRILRRFGDIDTPLYVGEIKTSDVVRFEAFLRKEIMPTKNIPDRIVERSQNTINSKLRRFRALCNYCVEIGLAESNPFDRYSIKTDVYGTPTWLTIEERDAVFNTHFVNPSLEQQKDIFVFQCLIGCRVSDLLSFTNENLTDDGFIQYIQHKLRKSKPQTIRVPLTDTAKAIIEKYSGQPNGRLLPFISQVKYDVAIKKVLEEAKITRMVLVQNKKTYEYEPKRLCDIASSHLARRTFMSNMFHQTHSEKIVSSFTGHAEKSVAFKRYAEVDDEMKKQIIAGIDVK